MNGNFKRNVYIIGIICVVLLIISVFIHFLPLILLVGIVGYIIVKIAGFIKMKKKQRELHNYKSKDNSEYSYNESADDYTNGEVIDVEYEDVGDKKN